MRKKKRFSQDKTWIGYNVAVHVRCAITSGLSRKVLKGQQKVNKFLAIE